MKFMYKRLTFFHKALWIDLETSGLDPNNCAIVQIAVLVEEYGKITDKFISYVQPFKGAKIEPQALKVNKIKKEDFPEFPLEHQVFKDFTEFLNKHVSPGVKSTKLTLTGFNVGFDIDFLKAMFNRNNNNDLFYEYFHKYSYDVASDVAKARLLQRISPNQSMSLNNLCKAFGVSLRKAHDAESDIKATRNLSHKILEFINDLTDPYSNGPDNTETEVFLNEENSQKKGISRFWANSEEWDKL